MLMGTRLRGFAIAAAALLAVAPVSALAQDDSADQPVVVVSVTNLERLTKDVSYVTTAVEQGDAGNAFQMMSSLYTNGLDRKRPVGIAMMVVDGVPSPLAFLPTKDVKKFLKLLEGVTGPADDLGDGTLAIAAGSSLVFIRQVEDWAFVAQNRDLLDDLPADPTAWLAGMDEAYDIGVRVNVRALTPEQRAQAVALIREGFSSAMARQPEEQAEQIRQAGEQALEQLELAINETETLQFGFAIEPDAQRIVFEGQVVAAQGTELAMIYAEQEAIPSKFASVIQPDVAAFFHGATSISSKAIAQSKASLDQATASIRTALEQQEDLSDEDREQLEAFFDQLIEIGVETLDEGKSDAGGLLTLENQELNAVAGFFVSDGTKVADLAKELAAKIEEKAGANNKLRFSFDADTYKGITLHYVETDVPAKEDKAQMIFGEVLRLTIGTGDDSVYLALGQQSQALLKGLIDSAGTDDPTDRPLSQIQINLLPILEFAQAVNPSEPLAAMIDKVANYDDVDSVTIISTSIDRGTNFELAIGEGLLRAIGAVAAAQMNAQNAQPAF